MRKEGEISAYLHALALQALESHDLILGLALLVHEQRGEVAVGPILHGRSGLDAAELEGEMCVCVCVCVV